MYPPINLPTKWAKGHASSSDISGVMQFFTNPTFVPCTSRISIPQPHVKQSIAVPKQIEPLESLKLQGKYQLWHPRKNTFHFFGDQRKL